MTVVTDTSVVLNLSWLRLEPLLSHFFDHILAPVEVREEFERLARSDSRFLELIFPAFIQIANASEIPASLRREIAWTQERLPHWRSRWNGGSGTSSLMNGQAG